MSQLWSLVVSVPTWRRGEDAIGIIWQSAEFIRKKLPQSQGGSRMSFELGLRDNAGICAGGCGCHDFDHLLEPSQGRGSFVKINSVTYPLVIHLTPFDSV